LGDEVITASINKYTADNIQQERCSQHYTTPYSPHANREGKMAGPRTQHKAYSLSIGPKSEHVTYIFHRHCPLRISHWQFAHWTPGKIFANYSGEGGVGGGTANFDERTISRGIAELGFFFAEVASNDDFSTLCIINYIYATLLAKSPTKMEIKEIGR